MMDALRSYLTTAMLASVASAICIQFTDERFRKYVKFIAGLCILAVLVLPLTTLVPEIGSIDLAPLMNMEDAETDATEYLNLLGEQLARSVGDRVARRHNLPREVIYVNLALDTTDLSSIELVSIELTVTTECDEEAIERVLSDEFACEVSVKEVSSDETADE